MLRAELVLQTPASQRDFMAAFSPPLEKAMRAHTCESPLCSVSSIRDLPPRGDLWHLAYSTRHSTRGAEQPAFPARATTALGWHAQTACPVTITLTCFSFSCSGKGLLKPKAQLSEAKLLKQVGPHPKLLHNSHSLKTRHSLAPCFQPRAAPPTW